MNLQPDGLHKGAFGIVVLEVEDADREAHAGHAVDQHVERLRLARAGIAGDENAEVQELGFVLERRPVDLAAILVAAEHNGFVRGRAAARDRNGRGRRRGFLGFILIGGRLDIRKLHDVGEGGHFCERARLALPRHETRGVLEIAEEMPRGIEPLPGQHLDLRHDDGLHLLGVADDWRDEAT